MKNNAELYSEVKWQPYIKRILIIFKLNLLYSVFVLSHFIVITGCTSFVVRPGSNAVLYMSRIECK